MAYANSPPIEQQGAVVAGASAHGAWKDVTLDDFLGRLAEDIERGIGADARIDGKPLSVPDVWATLAIFRRDLCYMGAEKGWSARRDRAVATWRGLLALLALSPAFPYRLQTRPLDLSEFPAIRRQELAMERVPEERIWGTIANMSLPSGVTVLDDQKWSKLTILEFGWEEPRQGGGSSISLQPLGIFNPATLVAPGRNYLDSLLEPNPLDNKRLPWAIEGGLGDPCKCNLEPAHYEAIALFVDKLAGVIEAGRDAKRTVDPDLAAALLMRLRNYRQDCRVKPAPLNRKFYDAPIDWFLAGNDELSNTLRSAVRIGQPIIAEYETALMAPEPASSGDFKGLLLCDADGLLTLADGASADRLKVWGDSPLSTVRHNPSVKTWIETEARKKGLVLVDVDDLLSETLLRFARTENQEGDPPSLLPVNPVLLSVMSVPDMAKAISIKPAADGRLTVALSLTLTSSENKRVAVVARRDFDAERQREIGQPLGLAVWPDFRSSLWSSYLGYSLGLASGTQIPAAISGESLLDSLGRSQPGSSSVALVSRLVRGDFSALKKPRSISSHDPIPGTRGAIFDSERPIDAFVVTMTDAVAGDALAILPIELEAAPSPSNASAYIGIDFGTTNTCVAARFADQPPETLSFGDHLALPLRPSLQPRLRTVFHHFIGQNIPSPPFTTAIAERPDPASDVEDRVPLWRSYIWWTVDSGNSVLEVLGARGATGPRQQLHFNLKWASDPITGALVHNFVRQIAYLGYVEALRRGISPEHVHWRYSFPLTKGFDVASFEGRVQQAIQDACPEMFRQTFKSRCGKAVSESEAATLFHASQQQQGLGGWVIGIDIGGGTSDVSVWADTKPTWHGAFELAGRRLLVAYLIRRWKMLGGAASLRADLKRAIDEIDGKLARDRNGRPAPIPSEVVEAAEIFLNHPDFRAVSEEFFRREAGTDHGRDLRLLMWFAIAGMVWLTGRQLKAQKAVNLRTAIDRVNIWFGGRGSLILKSFDTASDKLAACLGHVFKSACELKSAPKVEISYSDRPKEEVALGLLADLEEGDDRNLRAFDPAAHEAIVGEVVNTPAGEPILPYAKISDVQFDEALSVGKLAEIETFLHVLKTAPGTKIFLDLPQGNGKEAVVGNPLDNARSVASLTVKGKTEVAGGRAKPGSKVLTEPLFIVALRELVAQVVAGDLRLTERPD